MTNLYTLIAKNQPNRLELSEAEVSSVTYHDIFDYPLSFSELIKWKMGEGISFGSQRPMITDKNGYFFLDGRAGLIYKRLLRERISDKKLEIAKRVAKILRFVPSIRLIGITGSLAMNNSGEESDIDLLVITNRFTLWTTRLLVYIAIRAFGFDLRKPNERQQKNKLCLNMWLDEGDLVWPKDSRNIYTAHEIAQIKPLVNKDNIYEKLLYKNKWILKYWPNAVKIQKHKFRESRGRVSIIEWLAYKLQLVYMKPKITREIVTPTRAVFHPQDWGSVVLARLKQKYEFL